jgi:hypothetical protein
MSERKWTSLEFVNVFVLLMTLIILAFQAYETWRHDIRTVRPLLSFETEPDETQDVVGLSVQNVGVGPAVVKSIRIYVDRIPVKDWDEAKDRGAIKYDAREFEFHEGTKIGVNEKDLLFGENTHKRQGKPDDLSKLLDFIDKHVSVSITYCSLYDECQTECSEEGRCQ